jgi:hypothetical protein
LALKRTQRIDQESLSDDKKPAQQKLSKLDGSTVVPYGEELYIGHLLLDVPCHLARSLFSRSADKAALCLTAMQMAQLATSINAQNEDEHLFTKKSSFAANEVGIEFVSFTWQA